jgi:hypothetical protein
MVEEKTKKERRQERNENMFRYYSLNFQENAEEGKARPWSRSPLLILP